MKIGAITFAAITSAIALSLLTMPEAAAQWTQKGVTVDCAWVQPTQNRVAPVYMEIRADSQTSQRLTAVFSDLAEAAEISSYTRVAGVLQRQQIPYLPIEPGQAVQLLPGGYHILLVGLKEPLIAGTRFGVWLEFGPDNGFEVQIQVVRPGAGAPCAVGTGIITPPPPPPPPRGSF